MLMVGVYDFNTQRRIFIAWPSWFSNFISIAMVNFIRMNMTIMKNTLKNLWGLQLPRVQTQKSPLHLFLEHNTFGNHRNYHSWGRATLNGRKIFHPVIYGICNLSRKDCDIVSIIAVSLRRI
ncbi:Uncharacterised protein [Pasteurella bettyae]|nr:Uncharacterised protein [Pasteurella bettyae]